MTAAKTILILGSGIGGIVAASLLRKQLARKHRIILVEREPRHVFPPPAVSQESQCRFRNSNGASGY